MEQIAGLHDEELRLAEGYAIMTGVMISLVGHRAVVMMLTCPLRLAGSLH